jgi:hypothetical protein
VIAGSVSASHLSAGVLLYAATGFLGGYTTFSPFTYEPLRLLEYGAWRLALWNVALAGPLCFMVAGAGFFLAKGGVRFGERSSSRPTMKWVKRRQNRHARNGLEPEVALHNVALLGVAALGWSRGPSWLPLPEPPGIGLGAPSGSTAKDAHGPLLCAVIAVPPLWPVLRLCGGNSEGLRSERRT